MARADRGGRTSRHPDGASNRLRSVVFMVLSIINGWSRHQNELGHLVLHRQPNGVTRESSLLSGRARPTGWHQHLPWWGRTATAVRQRFVRAPTNAGRPRPTTEHVHAAQTVCDGERRWSGAPRNSFRFNVYALAGREGLGEAGDARGGRTWAGCGIPSTSRRATTHRPGAETAWCG